MTRCYSIDWLSLWCTGFSPVDRVIEIIKTEQVQLRNNDGTVLFSGQYSMRNGGYELNPAAYRWGYKAEQHGTRQFKKLVTVTYDGDEFAVVAYEPCSSIFKSNECMVKFSNRVLYRHDMWELIDHFLADHKLRVNNITRCDLCCDFNHFEHYECVPFIEDIMNSKLRHVGRSRGAAYFNELKRDEIERRGKCLVYSGISYGGHDSDAHVYLYNKSYELKTIKEKPYIRDLWVRSRLDLSKDVWRLEVSLKSKAMKFHDRKEDEVREVTQESLHDVPEVVKIYHTFTDKLFRFVRNRKGITNITREYQEHGLRLWGNDTPSYDRAVLRPVTGSTRTERILIKQLHLMADTYRDPAVKDYADVAEALAETIAAGTDLTHWYHVKQVTWDKPHHK